MIIRIRIATERDLDIVVPMFDLYRQFYKQRTDPARARTFLAARLARLDSAILLASAEEGADTGLGFVQLYPSFSSVSTASTFILNDLFVVPAARGQGVASALMYAARDHACRANACRLELMTARDNQPAQALYRRLGYEESAAFTPFVLQLPAEAREAAQAIHCDLCEPGTGAPVDAC